MQEIEFLQQTVRPRRATMADTLALLALVERLVRLQNDSAADNPAAITRAVEEAACCLATLAGVEHKAVMAADFDVLLADGLVFLHAWLQANEDIVEAVLQALKGHAPQMLAALDALGLALPEDAAATKANKGSATS